MSGKWRPMSPSAAAPNSASVMACSSASASEWPSRPWLCGTVTPPSTSGRPVTSWCTSQPSPTLRLGRLGRAGVPGGVLSAVMAVGTVVGWLDLAAAVPVLASLEATAVVARPPPAWPASSAARRLASRRSAKAKSPGQVTFRFSQSPRTSSGRRPSASTALASSVTWPPVARSASASRPMRNICGVCAAHLPARSTVYSARPSTSCLRVSASGRASRPPGPPLPASLRQASIRRSTHSGLNRQRAASCTSTQSCGRAPRRNSSARPLATLSARLAPPTGTAQIRSP